LGLPAQKPAQVQRIERTDQLLGGPLASGEIGDFRLENDRFAVVVANLGHPLAGALLDGCLREAGADSLRSLAPVVGRTRLTMPRFERLELEELGGTVTLRLVGTDERQPDVQLTHEYTLDARSPYLRITTTVKNRGAQTLLQYRVGDRIDWGATLPFAPGVGRMPRGTPSLAWIAGWSEGASYGYSRRGTAMSGALEPQVSTVVLDTLEVAPDAQVEVQRLLTIGPGGQIADILPPILASQGVTAGRLDVTIQTLTGDPLPNATLEVELEGRPFAVGRSDESGGTSMHLPAGHYQVRAHTADRTTPSAPVGINPERIAPLMLKCGPSSRLVFDLRQEGTDAPFPVKLALFGVDGTPTPWFAPACSIIAPSAGTAAEARRTACAGNTLLSDTGRGVLPLPPGRYRVVASHGPEFTIHSETLQLPPSSGASLTARLRRVVATTGYLGVDIDQRSLHSPGCGVSLADRSLSNLVEGVDAAVLTDLDHVTRTPQTPGLLSIGGVSHRSRRLGLTTLFPATPELMEDLDGLLAGSVAPAAVVVELAQPRRPTGLFALLDYDPNRPAADAVPPVVSSIRILDGRHPEDFDQSLEDWLSQLRVGRRLTATGGSGSRAIFGGEAGYPRTYVAVPRMLPPDQIAGQIAASLRAGQAVVSSGPFIALKVNGEAPGGTVAAPLPRRRRRGRVELTVEVTVSAPSWIGLDSLTLYVGGDAWGDPTPIPGRADGVRLEQTFKVPVTRDSFIVALARGSSPSTPVVNSPSSPLMPLALTNPVWIDTNGNGRYDPPGK